MTVMSDRAIKTVGEIGLERLDTCSKEIGQQFLPAVRPCFGVERDGIPKPFGTCFFMQIGDRPLLVTAAHVIDESDKTTIYVSNNETLVTIEGTFMVTNNSIGRDKDRFDFAVLELSEKQCEQLDITLFINEKMLCQNRSNKTKRCYMALGFPANMQNVHNPQKHIHSAAWTYVGFHKSNGELEKEIGISGKEHFIIRFEKKVKTFTGEIRNSIKPNGASGGVLIDLGNFDPDKLHPNTPCIGLLAGVLIEHHKRNKVIVATDIQTVTNAVRDFWSR